MGVIQIFITFAGKTKRSMAIKILSAKQFATKLKATIQASGRLGFTEETANALDLASGKFAKFAKDDEKGALYLIIINEDCEDAFPIKLSSGYYYVPTRQLFATRTTTSCSTWSASPLSMLTSWVMCII